MSISQNAEEQHEGKVHAVGKNRSHMTRRNSQEHRAVSIGSGSIQNNNQSTISGGAHSNLKDDTCKLFLSIGEMDACTLLQHNSTTLLGMCGSSSSSTFLRSMWQDMIKAKLIIQLLYTMHQCHVSTAIRCTYPLRGERFTEFLCLTQISLLCHRQFPVWQNKVSVRRFIVI